METYCVKEKKKTKCVEPSGTKTAKNGRPMAWCTCASCGIRKFRFVKGTSSTPLQTTTTTPKRKPKTTRKPRKPKN